MLIPLGHEQSTVRRQPLVTFTIMGLCILIHLFMSYGPGTSEFEVEQRFEDALAFWSEHPYLDLDPRLDEELQEMFPGTLYHEYVEALKEFCGPPATGSVRISEQMELDQTVEAAYSGLEEILNIKWGLVPSRFSVITLVTHIFLHAGWLHLIGNLFFLYLCGPFIEDVWGRPIFVAFYLLAGMFAGGVFAARYPDMDIPLIGASGAVAGVMGAFLIRYWHIKIRFFYWFGFFFRGTFSAPAWLMLPLWFLRELAAAGFMDSMDPTGEGGGVAFWAHVFGFLFGIGAALTMNALKVESRYLHPSMDKKITLLKNTAVEEAMDAEVQGRTGDAMARLKAEVAANPENQEALVAYWNLAVKEGSALVVAPAFQRLLRREVVRGEMELAAVHWSELRAHTPEVKIETAIAALIAEHLNGHDERMAAAEVIETALDQLDPDTPPGALMRLARAAGETKGGLALRAVESALAHPELDEEAKAELEERKRDLERLAATPNEPAGDPCDRDADERSEPGMGADEGIEHGLMPGADPQLPEGDLPDMLSTQSDDWELDPSAFDEPSFQTETDNPLESLLMEQPEESAISADFFDEPAGSDAGSTLLEEPLGLAAGASLLDDTETAESESFQTQDSAIEAPESPMLESIDSILDQSIIDPFDNPLMNSAASDETAGTDSDLESRVAADDLNSDDTTAWLPDSDIFSGAAADTPAFDSTTFQANDDAPVMEEIRTGATPQGLEGNQPPGAATPNPDAVCAAGPALSFRLFEAEPQSIEGGALTVDVKGKGKARFLLERIQVISVAVIRVNGAAPSLLLDLFLDLPGGNGRCLHGIRMRSGRINPRALVPDAPNSAVALNRLIRLLLESSGAQPLPNESSLLDHAYPTYEAVQQYEEELRRLIATLNAWG